MKRIIAISWLLLCAPVFAQVPMTGAGKGAPTVSGAPMTTPILVLAGFSPNPSNSTTNFSSLLGGRTTSPFSATESFVTTPMPIAGTIKNLNVFFPTTLSAGSWAISVSVNGSTVGAPTCTVTSVGPVQACSDSSSSIAVAVGDLVSIKYVPTGTPTAQTFVQVSVTLTGTNNGESVIFSGGPVTPSNTAANYVTFGGMSAATATESTVSAVVATGGVIDNMSAKSTSSPASTVVMTLFKNGVATPLTCTFSGSTCTTTAGTNAVTVSAGDLISTESCPGPYSVGSCAPASTPSMGNIRTSYRWRPTTSGEALAFGGTNVTTYQAGATNWIYVNGSGGTTTAEAAIQNITPVAMTYKKLYSWLSIVPGGATTRTFTLRQGTGASQSNTSVTCTVASAATTCQDSSNSYSSAAGNLIDMQTTVSATTSTPFGKIGMVLTVP